MTADPSRAALVTGCSSGIGRATALGLRRGGFEVYATARRPESIADLTAAGITTFPLDVTDETSMTEVVGQITAERGAVALLVNNAGYELAGPVEEIPPAVLTSLNAKNIVAGGHDGGPYTAFRHDLADWHARTYAGPPRNIAGRLAVSADDVATVIARAASTRRPRARYPVGTLARGLFALQHWLPGRAFDAFIRTQFPRPGSHRKPARSSTPDLLTVLARCGPPA